MFLACLAQICYENSGKNWELKFWELNLKIDNLGVNFQFKFSNLKVNLVLSKVPKNPKVPKVLVRERRTCRCLKQTTVIFIGIDQFDILVSHYV